MAFTVWRFARCPIAQAQYDAKVNSIDCARSALRSATHDHHQRVDKAYSIARMNDRASYGRFLLAQAAAYIPVEMALECGGIASIIPDWPRRRRAGLLRADLQEIGLELPPPVGEPTYGTEEALLGAAYVLEGSRLGGTLLKRSVPRAFPTRFLSNADSAAWRSLLRRLDEGLDTPGKRATAIIAAQSVFALFEESGIQHLKLTYSGA